MEAGIWTKLTSLYMTKSLANRLYLKKKMYTYYMSPGTKQANHIDEFNKLILDLANINIEIEGEDRALMLLTMLPSSYENFMETLLYGKESLTMKDVLATLSSRELKKRTKGTKKETGDGLYVRGRSDHLGKANSARSSRFKSRGGTGKLKFFICHFEGHLKSDCPMKKSSGFVKKGKRDQDSDSSDDEGNAYFGKALVVVENDEMTKLVMDSAGSYHMTHIMDFLYDFKGFDGGLIQLGDNRTCTIKGTRKKKDCVYTLEAKVMTFGVQKHGGSIQVRFKQLSSKKVRFKQLAPGVETRFHESTSSRGTEGNVVEKNKVKESMEANLGKLLKFGCGGIKRRFLIQKGSRRGRGVKEKDLNKNKRNTTSGIGLSIESDDTMNEDTPVGVASAIKEGLRPFVVDKTVEKEKLSSSEDTTVLGSFPPSTPVLLQLVMPLARIMELKQRYFKDYYSDDQYAISIKEDMAYLCPHSPKTTKKKDSIRERTFELHPYHFTYSERRLMMEEMLYKFIDEGNHEQEEIRAFIHEFRTTNELLFKERNNSLSEQVRDLGASISLMPYTMYEKLSLGEPKATRMSLKLANRSIQYPMGMIENVLIKVDKFILPIDFVILDMPEDSRVPIILGRPFLATARAMIDSFNKKITLKKGGMTVVLNDNNELIPSRTVTGWRVYINYQKLNDATRKDHFHLPFIDQMLERLCGNEYYYFLDGFLGFFQIPIAPEDQEKTTFTCPYGTFAYRRMPFRLCNAPATFQRCMTVIFHDMVKEFMEVFTDDFLVFGNSFDYCLANLDRMLARCEETNHVLNWENVILWAKKLVVDHLSRLENPNLGTFMEAEMNDKFLNEHLMILKTKWLFARFRVHKALISDQGTYFCNSQLEKALQKYEVTHKLSSTYHPQTNGQTEVTNRAIKRILERPIGYNMKNWSDKLDDTLWAFRTAYKTPTGCTPFRLFYGKAFHLPVEIEYKAYWALKHCNMDLTAAVKNRFMKLNEFMELRDGAYVNTMIYKERTKRWHDSRLRGDKNFKVGDKVLLFNFRFKMHLGKLKSRWYGPNLVKTVHSYGTIEIIDRNIISFKVNGQRLKKYHDDHTTAADKEDLDEKKSTKLVKYQSSGILYFRTWLGISSRDHNNEYYGF
nr:reverse transcriptase domain-containing protein [Tanacetum cinerariifolium]